jgi:hypothetical protein
MDDSDDDHDFEHDTYEAFSLLTYEDNVSALITFLEKNKQFDINKRRSCYYMHEDITWSPIHLAAFYGAKHMTRYLLANVERDIVVRRCMPNHSIDEVYFESKSNGGSNGFKSECEIDIENVDHTALQLATMFHGRDSECARLLRGDDALRRGFDAFYYRAFRRSFAPDGKAAKRVRSSFTQVFKSTQSEHAV